MANVFKSILLLLKVICVVASWYNVPSILSESIEEMKLRLTTVVFVWLLLHCSTWTKWEASKEEWKPRREGQYQTPKAGGQKRAYIFCWQLSTHYWVSTLWWRYISLPRPICWDEWLVPTSDERNRKAHGMFQGSPHLIPVSCKMHETNFFLNFKAVWEMYLKCHIIIWLEWLTQWLVGKACYLFIFHLFPPPDVADAELWSIFFIHQVKVSLTIAFFLPFHCFLRKLE